MAFSFSKLPIRTKLVLSFTLVLTAILIMVIMFSIHDNKQFALEAAKYEIRDLAKMVAETTKLGFDNLDFENARNSIEWLKRDPRLTLIGIYDNDNQIIAGFNQARLGLEAASLAKLEEPLLKGEDLYWSLPISHFDPVKQYRVEKGWVLIGLSLKSLNQEIWFNQRRSIAFAFLAFLMGIALTVYLAEQISRPIVHLAGISNQVAKEKDFELRAVKSTQDELGVLIDQFNEMLSQIQKQNAFMQNVNVELEARVRERTKELEKAKEEAVNANVAKNEFLSRMSHELRTPLNAILGFSQLLEMQAEQNPETVPMDYVQPIRISGDHLLALVDEVLDLAQIESGEMEFALEEVEVPALIKELMGMLEPMANEYQIELVEEFDPGEPQFVIADKTRLRQILLNLVTNAIKYNDKGGKVKIFYAVKDSGYLRITVEDTGFGIPKEKEAKLYEPFERLHWEEVPIDGAGIGLTISKKLVTSMNGSIGFHSVEGVGSSFYIDLPLPERPPGPDSAPLDEKPEKNKAGLGVVNRLT